MKKVAGVVLSGGLSQRMGQDKAQLILQGQSLLQHCVQQLQNTSVDEVLISGREPNQITDIYPQQGPLSGMHAVITQHKFDGYLFVPVDMPNLTSDDLQLLLAAGNQQPEPCCFHGYHLPLYLPYSNALLSYLEHQLSSKGNCSVGAMLEAFCAHGVTAPDAEVMGNINSPQQWQALLKRN